MTISGFFLKFPKNQGGFWRKLQFQGGFCLFTGGTFLDLDCFVFLHLFPRHHVCHSWSCLLTLHSRFLPFIGCKIFIAYFSCSLMIFEYHMWRHMVHVNQDFMKDVCIDDMVYKGLVWICFNLCLQSVFSQYSDQPCLRQLTSDTV